MSLSAKVLENLRVFGSFPLAEFEKLLSITILELCKGIHQLNIEALGEKYGLDTEILQESLDSLVFTILHLVRMDVSQEIITTVINPLYLPIEYIQVIYNVIYIYIYIYRNMRNARKRSWDI